jgi:hypothetical protein
MMRSHKRTSWRLALAAVAVFGFTAQFGQVSAIAAGTAPATVISNTATASYVDGNGNSYTTNSNTVTTTVQNAPSVSVTPPTAQTVSPGQVVVDTYTLTNTGNGPANFTLPAAATVGTNGTLVGYVVAGTNCTAAAPCTLANANTALAALTPTAAAGTIAVGIEYTVASTATAGTTIPTVLSAATTQAAASQTVNAVTTTVPAATSATTTGTITDTVAAQARLDIAKAITAPTSATAPITFTITANNGGGFPATDLTSVKTLLGSANPGVLITDAIPAFPAGGTPLTLSGTPTATLPGGNTGSTATIYYSTSATGAAGSWSTTYAAGDYFIGVLVSGGTGGVELPSKPAGSTGAGSVTTPQVTLTFATVQPTGSGAADSGAIKDVANSVIGGNPGATGVTPIIGPNIPAGTADGTAPTTPITAAVDNTTPVTPNGSTAPPGGASNQASGAAFSSAVVLNGPADAAGATGSYPAAPNNGAGAASNQLDYTAVSFGCGTTGTTTSVTGTPCIVPTAGVSVPGSYTNSGNAADTLGISVVVPVGFTATIYNATCPATIAAGTNITTACTKTGAAIGTGSATTSATGTATASFGSVPSGGSGNYVVVYTPLTAGTTSVPNGTPIDSTVTVSGTAGSANDANATHIDLFPGGPVTLNKSAAVVTGCTGTGQSTTSAVCPGGTITYSIAFASTAAIGSTGSNLGTEPSYATQGLTASNIVITEDGTGGNAQTLSNNWATYSNGLTAAPTVVNTVGSTSFTFVYSPTAGTAVGSTKFTATATTIAAGSAGTISFSVTVK